MSLIFTLTPALLLLAGSEEFDTDSRVFCVSVHHLATAHGADGGGPAMSSGSGGSHGFIPPQTVPFGSGAGEKVSPLCSESSQSFLDRLRNQAKGKITTL